MPPKMTSISNSYIAYFLDNVDPLFHPLRTDEIPPHLNPLPAGARKLKYKIKNGDDILIIPAVDLSGPYFAFIFTGSYVQNGSGPR